MKLYKSTTDEIFAYEEDGSQDYLIGDKVALTQSEIDARETLFAQQKTEQIAAEQAIKNAKQSALAKLTALGLTANEIAHLIP
jgi:hypothetical protein